MKQTSLEKIDEERYKRIIVESAKKIIAERGEATPYTFILNGSLFANAALNLTVDNINAPGGGIVLNAGGGIFSINPEINDLRALGVNLTAQTGVLGTAEAPLLIDILGDGGLTIFAGGQQNGLSVNIHSNVGRTGTMFGNVPPGLVLMNNHIEGGGNLQSLFKSVSINYRMMQEAFWSYGQYGRFGDLHDQPALEIPEMSNEAFFIRSGTVEVQEPEILITEGPFTDL